MLTYGTGLGSLKDRCFRSLDTPSPVGVWVDGGGTVASSLPVRTKGKGATWRLFVTISPQLIPGLDVSLLDVAATLLQLEKRRGGGLAHDGHSLSAWAGSSRRARSPATLTPSSCLRLIHIRVLLKLTPAAAGRATG